MEINMSETVAEPTQDAPQDPTTDAPEEPTTDKVDGEDSLGDKGKKALDAMKAERNAARDESRKFREELDALRAQVEGREAEYKAEQDRRAVEQSALQKANDRILKAEVRAAAAGKLHDPADALLNLDLSSFEVGDDGEVDASAIAAALDSLIASKPYLAVQDSKRFQGDIGAGTRKESRPSQLTRTDLDRMSPQEISQARAEGRFDDLLGRTR